jgi:hypothetical protein
VLTEKWGIEVECKVLSQQQLLRAAPSMFYYDLAVGHRQTAGITNLFAECSQLKLPGLLPHSEATRLLMNRGTGLLLCGQHLRVPALSSEQTDFVVRNVSKAQLALGDALLTVEGRYHWNCRERHRRLAAFFAAPQSLSAEILEDHKKGVDFKLHPALLNPDRSTLQQQWREVAARWEAVWCWVESRRWNRKFETLADLLKVDRKGTTGMKDRIRAAYLWKKAFGWRHIVLAARGVHPREQIFSALPLLLADQRTGALQPRRTALIRCWTCASDDAESMEAAYLKSWRVLG